MPTANCSKLQMSVVHYYDNLSFAVTLPSVSSSLVQLGSFLQQKKVSGRSKLSANAACSGVGSLMYTTSTSETQFSLLPSAELGTGTEIWSESNDLYQKEHFNCITLFTHLIQIKDRTLICQDSHKTKKVPLRRNSNVQLYQNN